MSATPRASSPDVSRYAALFQAEAREHLATVDAALLALEQQDVDAATDASTHAATLFRGVHTIKGMAGAMGYVRVEALAHALESRSESLRVADAAPDAALVALLFEGVDALSAAIDVACAGLSDAQDDRAYDALLERLRVRAPEPVRASPVESGSRSALRDAMPTPATVQPVGDERPLLHVDVTLTADCPLKGVRAMIVLTRLRGVGTVQGITPPLEQWQDSDFDGRFQVSLRTSASADELSQAAHGAGEVAKADVRAAVARQANAAPAVRAPARTVRLDAQHLDTLLELVGELVVTRDRLIRASDGAASTDRELRRATRDTARIVSALQAAVLEARLLPAADVFDRFPRLVRDVARELGKDVAFVVEGRELEIDRALLDAIGDPILHLLRNALDHGLEKPDARRAAGKKAQGTLTLRAVRERASLRIEVSDDGRGIDREAVASRAQSQGLAVPAVVDDAELLRLVAHPGLSTATAVTSMSGRGVGVDVVHTRVRALGGQLELTSTPGVGTTFTLRLPATVAITRALLVEVSGQSFAIPAVHVEEVLAWHPTLRLKRPGGPAVTVRDEVVPLVALAERFGLPRSSAQQGEEEAHLAIVEQGGRRCALLVDALVAQQDIVVKPLDLVRGSAPWFAGATILGDGRPALILDVGAFANGATGTLA